MSELLTNFSKASIINSLDTIEDAQEAIAHRRIKLRILAKLDSFHPFPQLPIELRLKIWHLLMPPRVVSIAYKQDTNNGIPTAFTPWDIWGCGTPSPITLQICQESRVEALRKYKLRLDTVSRDCYMRMDPDNDTLLIREVDGRPLQNPPRRVRNTVLVLFGSILKPEVLQSVKKLAVDIEIFYPVGNPNNVPRRPFESFSALETLDLVTDYYFYRSRKYNSITVMKEDGPEFIAPRGIYGRIRGLVVAEMDQHSATHQDYIHPKIRFVEIRE